MVVVMKLRPVVGTVVLWEMAVMIAADEIGRWKAEKRAV